MKNPDGNKIERPSADSAEALAITILTWLSNDPALMSRFLAISGIDPGSIRQMIGDPGFYAGLTGFLMNHEPTLMQFCAEAGVKVEWVQACHNFLAGPGEGAWL